MWEGIPGTPSSGHTCRGQKGSPPQPSGIWLSQEPLATPNGPTPQAAPQQPRLFSLGEALLSQGSQ